MPIKPSRPKKSLWSGIFGGKIKSASVVRPSTSFGNRINTSEFSNKNDIRHSSAPIKSLPKQKNTFLNAIGPAQSPVKSTVENQISPAMPSFELKNKSQKTKVNFKNSPELRRKKPGFMVSLMNLFSPKPKMTMPGKPLVMPVKPNQSNNSRPVVGVKTKYHTAPKAEKSKIDINLVPQELLFKTYPKNKQQIIGTILAILMPALIITAVYLTIDQQEKKIESNIAGLTENKNKLAAYINDFKGVQEKNIILQDKLLAINKLLTKHIYWTKFFGLLEKYTLDNVYYSEFTADTSGKFMLPAIAAIGSGSTIEEQIADSYRKVAQQITAFEKASDFVKQVKVNNLEVVSGDKAGIKGVKFDINLTLNDGVFTNENN